ncbi:glycosyltransferase family 4 protein, partial [Candidatus Roizmanbacteria bacterium]|nr:glycosyltransferase family 4 protein [Candidatus Roizmanbacteria bacterium]
ERLVQAMSQLSHKCLLVMAGPNDFFWENIQDLVIRLGVSDRVQHFSDISQSKLAYLYKNCIAVVFPSLSEGFGLPLVEGVYFHKPIIGSDIPVFKELLGDQYIQFDPTRTKDIAGALDRFLATPGTRTFKPDIHNCSFKRMTDKIVHLYALLTS